VTGCDWGRNLTCAQPRLTGSTRWSTTLSSTANLPHAIDFRALCGSNLVTFPADFRVVESLERHRAVTEWCVSDISHVASGRIPSQSAGGCKVTQNRNGLRLPVLKTAAFERTLTFSDPCLDSGVVRPNVRSKSSRTCLGPLWGQVIRQSKDNYFAI
jgi:hypothetical protein